MSRVQIRDQFVLYARGIFLWTLFAFLKTDWEARMDSFGELLATARRKRKLLQKQLAYMAGFDASYLGALERGRKEAPSPRLFKALLDALNPTPTERKRLVHALVVMRLHHVLNDGPAPVEGGAVILKIAQGLPYLDEADLDLIETLVERLSRAGARREGAV